MKYREGKMLKSTTILTVRRGHNVALGGDGQVTLGHTVVKHGARKIRKIHQITSKYLKLNDILEKYGYAPGYQ